LKLSEVVLEKPVIGVTPRLFVSSGVSREAMELWTGVAKAMSRLTSSEERRAAPRIEIYSTISEAFSATWNLADLEVETLLEDFLSGGASAFSVLMEKSCTRDCLARGWKKIVFAADVWAAKTSDRPPEMVFLHEVAHMVLLGRTGSPARACDERWAQVYALGRLVDMVREGDVKATLSKRRGHGFFFDLAARYVDMNPGVRSIDIVERMLAAGHCNQFFKDIETKNERATPC